jgi:polyphenol oxidase
VFIQPQVFNRNILAAQSTRVGGFSQAPFYSNNLGLSVNDDENTVRKNRATFFEKLNIDENKVARSFQVHDDKILYVTEPIAAHGYDALITNQKNVYLAVTIADCAPILIHDTKNNAIAAIHAGWKGTVKQITRKTLLEMNKQFGTQGQDCKAFIGACISIKNFEVGNEVAEHFSESLKQFDAEKQKWFVDLKQANKEQMVQLGLDEQNIEISEYCTVEHHHLFFSHRKENGLTGRMLAVIGMRSPKTN